LDFVHFWSSANKKHAALADLTDWNSSNGKSTSFRCCFCSRWEKD